MIHFILNNQEVHSESLPGKTLLDVIRYEMSLTGTKIGCREGDCGACSILVGEWKNNKVVYSNATSCLMPLANAAGKHIVTVEGINLSDLTAVQHAFSEEGATQCGFCTPGFIMSLTGYCITTDAPSYEGAVDAMNGNICRCTGYKSIQRAAGRVAQLLQEGSREDRLSFAINNGIIPAYFTSIPDRLKALPSSEIKKSAASMPKPWMGGGTDLYVQQHDTIAEKDIQFLFNRNDLKKIEVMSNRCEMGAAVTVADMHHSPVFQKAFPQLDKYIRLVSSEPIRNMATLAGNFINASPIGDLTIFFLALDASLVFTDGTNKREVPMRKLYKGYKSLDKKPEEMVEKICFDLPSADHRFNFEKVSKRTHLDIASVNSAMLISMKGNSIASIGISAGGVGPVPMYLEKTCAYLQGKDLTEAVLAEALSVAQTEISPIGDARGSAEYKRLLLSQLIKAHLITCFPERQIVV